MNSNELTAHGNSVLAEVVVSKETVEVVKNRLNVDPANGAITPVYYTGNVLSMGDTSKTTDQCPELQELTDGDKIVFSQMAGVAMATEDVYTKVINGFDIVAIIDIEGAIKPTNNRILVDVIQTQDIDEHGIAKGKSNPREADTQKCIVRSFGKSCDKTKYGFKEGDIVWIDPYCGNLIVDDGKSMIKTVMADDVIVYTSK